MAGVGDGEAPRPSGKCSPGAALLDAVAALCILCLAFSQITSGIALAAKRAGELHREVTRLIAEENERAIRSGSILTFP